MKVVPFIADNAAGALAQIHQQLGPDAVVLSVKPTAAPGLARLWNRRGRIEVLAGVEERPEPAGVGPELSAPTLPLPKVDSGPEPSWKSAAQALSWRSVSELESGGLMPGPSRFLQERLLERYGLCPPPRPDLEWSALRTVLNEFWRTPPPLLRADGCPHVFIGPSGSGKTTVLCKWLVQTMLAQGGSARVWRLDGLSANTAEFLNLYAEMFSLTVERKWQAVPRSSELLLVDLPGVDSENVDAVGALSAQLASLGTPRVHLVLNAAYETPILLQQIRTFARFKPEDVSFTHFNEGTRPAKLCNFVFGTNCSLRFLSSGQKIPGGLQTAEPELLVAAQNA